MKDTLGLPLSQAKGFNFTRSRGEPVIANFRPRVKSMLMDGDEIAVSVRARGGGVKQTKTKTKGATATARATQMQTKSNEKILLLEEMGKAIPTELQEMPVVVHACANVRKMVETMNSNGAVVALTLLFQGLRASNPEAFKTTLDYLKESGSNNATTKLNHVAPTIFGSSALMDLSEYFEKIATAPKIALNAVYEKAVSENKAFNISDVIKIMTTTDALFIANSAGATAKASAPAPMDDAEL